MCYAEEDLELAILEENFSGIYLHSICKRESRAMQTPENLRGKHSIKRESFH